MPDFKLTNKAKSDLVKIAKYTERQWGKEQRNHYLKQFDDAFHLLVEKTLIGKECHYIKTNYRKFLQGMHIIFYKQTSGRSIEIIRILHKNMDVVSKFE